jgi:hypothetical protein
MVFWSTVLIRAWRDDHIISDDDDDDDDDGHDNLVYQRHNH